MKRFRFIAPAVFAVLSASFFPGVVQAVGVNPPRQEFVLGLGEKAQGHVTVSNETQDSLEVTPSEKTWFLLPENAPLGVEEWLSFDQEPFVLKPDEKREIPFTVSVPAASTRTLQGFLVGMLSFVGNPEGQAVMVNTMISVSVYVTIRGTERPAWTVPSLKMSRDGDIVQAIFTVKNTGNVHLRPQGSVELFDKKGRTGPCKAVVHMRLWDRDGEQPFFFEIEKEDFFFSKMPAKKAQKYWE
jgi:hypothetical protein